VGFEDLEILFQDRNPHILKSSNSMFRLVVFDLDGTLVDSRRDLAISVNQVIVERGGRPLPEEAVGRMVGDGAATLVARGLEAAGLPAGSGALERFLSLYNQHLLDHTRPYPGIPEVLATLGTRATLGVLTNKPLAATREILAGLDLARHFSPDYVRGGDGPLPRKPDPAGLTRLIKDVGAEAHGTLLVGDSPIDWQTARAASTPICLARYGFGFSGFESMDLEPAACVIDEPHDLLSLT
jgi:phosphoglycolate phosphatase